MDKQVSKVQLAIQQVLRQQLDPIVQHANQDAALLQGSAMDNNQIRNVLNVAEESPSLSVVTNFIRYQLGRSQTGKDWRHAGFGPQVIKQIEAPDGIVAQQTKTILAQIEKPAEEPEILEDIAQALRYDLARYYLGYLRRAFVYGKETGKWDELRAQGGQDV